MFRLFSAHQQCTHLIDDLFPRKTLEQILEGMTGTLRRPSSLEQGSKHASPLPYAQPATDTFAQPLKAMTKSVDALTQEIRAHLQAESTPPAIYPIEAIAKTFAPLIQQLTLALAQLPKQLEPPPAQRFSSPQEVDHLVDDLTARITQAPHPTTGTPIRQPQGWLQRLRTSTHLLAPLSVITPGRTYKSRGPR
jgi:hypothetical protein